MKKLSHDSSLKQSGDHTVLVIGDFSEGGFAKSSWENIKTIFKGGDKCFPELASDDHRNKHGSREPFLRPIRLDDKGCASNVDFIKNLYSRFRATNVWGVISCCTARNSTYLIKALEPISVPVLICVDNTVDTAALSYPNLLQLIPNNALQAQAILSKVASEIQGNEERTVVVYCRRPEDTYVKDLWTSLENKAKDSENRRIRLKQITVGQTLQDLGSTLNEQDVVVYIGYHDGLKRLIESTRARPPKLLLCDGCSEGVAESYMRSTGCTWHVAVPSFEPRIYAYQAYISLSEVWRRSFPPHDYTLERRVTSLTSRLRSSMERVWSYRFVGAANQSGGYILKRVAADQS